VGVPRGCGYRYGAAGALELSAAADSSVKLLLRRGRAMESQVTLMRALVASVPAGMLFAGALALFLRGKVLSSILQLLGAGCLVVVVLAHICEALYLFPSMEWGLERSAGHYLDLWSAVLGLTSFPLGYLLHTFNLKPQ